MQHCCIKSIDLNKIVPANPQGVFFSTASLLSLTSLFKHPSPRKILPLKTLGYRNTFCFRSMSREDAQCPFEISSP